MWTSAIVAVVKRLKVWAACVVFGAAYGAVLGATIPTLGLILGSGLGDTFRSCLIGGAIGLGYGSVVGCLAGVIGNIIGGRTVWYLAGLLGVLAPIVLAAPWVVQWSAIGGDFYGQQIVFFLYFCGVPGVPIAGLLGIAVGRALRSGRSAVPGVTELITVINEAQPAERIARALGIPAELAPSSAPEGRGDETAPAVPPTSG